MINEFSDTSFSLDETKAINQTISNMYSSTADSQFSDSLSDFSTNFLHDLSNHVSFDKGNVMFYSFNPNIHAYEVTSFFQIGWQEDDLDSYIKHYVHLDDILPILTAEHEIAFKNGDIFSSRENTKYYKEFIEPAQISNSIDANILLPKNREINATIGLFRDVKKHDFSLKDLEIIKIFQPHLSNVLSHYSELRKSADNDLIQIFSNIESVCVCVLNDDLKLITYNSTFQTNIEAAGFTSPVDNEMFSKIQELCSIMKTEFPEENYHKSGRISMQINEQTYPVEIAYTRQENGSGKFICLILMDNFAIKLKELQTTYNLSQRECEVVNLILKRGFTNEEISICLHISTSTVKKHLTSVYQKIGVHNQKQLQTLFRKL